jgi:hypothetical protein
MHQRYLDVIAANGMETKWWNCLNSFNCSDLPQWGVYKAAMVA